MSKKNRNKKVEKVEVETPLTNDERIVDLTIDKDEGLCSITLPIENRLSGSEKSIVVAGVIGQMRVMVGDVEHVFACSLYRKNPNYDAEAARKRIEARKGSNGVKHVAATVVG